MEAGIEPAEPSNLNSLAYSTVVTLSEICIALIHNIKNVHTISKEEQNIILKLLQSTTSHMLLTLNICTSTIATPAIQRKIFQP
jgi:hypothetical protein